MRGIAQRATKVEYDARGIAQRTAKDEYDARGIAQRSAKVGRNNHHEDGVAHVIYHDLIEAEDVRGCFVRGHHNLQR